MRRKVKVTLPKAMSGGSNGESGRGMTAGLGLNSNTMPWPIMAGEFAQPDIAVNQSLKPVDVEDANLEAELGETAFIPDESGIPALYKIGGKRHYDGGTPLDLPEDSFIFSRDNKMKIGGPILESFGKKKDTKDKFTPAELSNQYKINDFRKVLADPNTDKTQRDTAETMIANYNLKLAKLGLVQESTKGFPDGIPAIAMPYLEMIQVDPSQFVAPQGQQSAPASMAKYGGGLPKAQEGKTLKRPSLDELYNAQQKLLSNINNPGFPELYDKLEAQIKARKKKGETLSENIPGESTGWYNAEQQRMDTPSQGSTGYWDRVGDRFGSDWANEQFINNGTDPSLLHGKIPTQAAKKTQEALSKLNPANAEGVIDYLGNALTIPQKGINLALTGNYETPGTTYLRTHPGNEGMSTLIDIGLDPLNFIGVGELTAGAKAIGTGTKTVAEYSKFLAQAIPAMTGLGIAKLQDFAIKYAPEIGTYIAKNGKKALESSYVQNVLARTALSLLNSSEDKADISYQQRKLNEQVPFIQPNYGVRPTSPVDIVPADTTNYVTPEVISEPVQDSTAWKQAMSYKHGGSLPKYIEGGTSIGDTRNGKVITMSGINKSKNVVVGFADGTVEIIPKTNTQKTSSQAKTVPATKSFNPTINDPDGKGIYKSSPGERTPEGLDPSSIYTQEELVQRYKDMGIDYANMTDAEAQAALYDKADPFDKAYMWGQVGNTKAGLASGQEAKFSKYKPLTDKLGNRESLSDYKKRLGTLGYTPESLNKELEPFKTSFADSLRGLREAWLLEPSKETSIASGKEKKENTTTPGPLSGGVGDEYFAPRPKWWLQDKIKTAGAFGDLMNIKKYIPWQATPGYALEQGTFYDPTRELAANAEMVNQGVTGASTFSGPQGYAATASMLQGQGAKNAADIMGRYNNMNVSEANRLSGVNTGIMNQASQQRANNATQLYDKQTVANQQFDNSKNMARQNLRQSFMDAITNRANTYNLNTLYPQYAINPSVGGMAYNPAGSNRRPTKEGAASDVESQINKIRKSSLSPADQDLWIKSLFGKGSDNQTG